MHKPQSYYSATTPPMCNCDIDPIACLKTMFVDMVQMGRIEDGQCPARRPVFLRLHGVARGRLEVVSDLPENLRVGLFGEPGKSYPVWVRYASDIPDGYLDKKTTVGIGIKVFDVPGEKILPPDECAPTMDLLLQNIDVFFVDNAQEMCEFTKAGFLGEDEEWLADHPRTQEILDEMAKLVPSVFETDLWSAMPFHFGEEGSPSHTYCKYKLVPEVVPPAAGEPDYDYISYLHTDLVERLQQGQARLKFFVQLRTNPATMPLDRATVPWSEAESPPIHVATLILPQQDITARGQAEYGETLSFHPWRTLKAHEPVGSIAEARKVVYQASAELRRNVNGEPIGEPQIPRPDTVWPPAKQGETQQDAIAQKKSPKTQGVPMPQDQTIVRAAIHPGIGIARMGNSTAEGENGYYIGPEVTDPPLKGVNNRDASGAIKRQAARFRIYGYNAAGEVVKELTSSDAQIEWTVHLANRKAQWYKFAVALDIPEWDYVPSEHRNPDVKGEDREQFAIDPGSRTIQGNNTSGNAYKFDSGRFMGVPVPLGELRTDNDGHLLVLGGLGKSGSPTDSPIYNAKDPAGFLNPNEWYDDASDGPVTATVHIGTIDIPVESSWVVVAPPNYAPGIVSWRTLYDLLVDTYIESGWMSMPTQASFTEHILPVLSRLSKLQWVNKGFASLFGKGGPMDFSDPDLIAKLAYKPPAAGGEDLYQELRRVVFNTFRPPETENTTRSSWPWIYGDAFGSTEDPSPDSSPRNNLALSKVRMDILKLWVEGQFENDWEPGISPPSCINEVELEKQPAMLDKAALHFCLADAFHPGCEVTWPMRHSRLYSAPFRVRHAQSPTQQDYGAVLTQEIALQPGGPLYAQGPGDLTRWMGIPWQADTGFCRSGYESEYDPYLPTFWPANVPNQVLTEENYNIIVNPLSSPQEKIEAFSQRESWVRQLPTTTIEAMEYMVEHFDKLGIIELRDGLVGNPDIPAEIFVESLTEEQAEKLRIFLADLASARSPLPLNLQRAGWASAEHLKAFRRVRLNR
ncbi:MAG: LodA/GoxA family CTQ-dependent oxidase [Cyanobacteria bacterium SBLK]|nr:LodA/GoxA family CTQ-dependent oxidase [Cyanobacteria bacterium SBLK]